MKNEKNIFIIFTAALFFIILSANIYNSIKSYKYRIHLDTVREQLADAEDTNRRFAEAVEKCQSICGELGCSIDRNINSAREAIELIEEIRVKVYELESSLGSFDQSEYYQRWDNYFHNEGLME